MQLIKIDKMYQLLSAIVNDGGRSRGIDWNVVIPRERIDEGRWHQRPEFSGRGRRKGVEWRYRDFKMAASRWFRLFSDNENVNIPIALRLTKINKWITKMTGSLARRACISSSSFFESGTVILTTVN